MSWSREGEAAYKSPTGRRDRYYKVIWPFPVVGYSQPHYVIARNTLTVDECQNLKAMASQRWIVERQNLPRNKQYAHVTPRQCRWLYERMQRVFLENNIWRFSVSGILRPATVLRYEQGYRIRPHCDWLPDDATYGKLSTVTMLSDPKDFTGGGLYIEESKTPVKLNQGDTVIFPSPMMHQVHPLESGERIVCAMWAGGSALV